MVVDNNDTCDWAADCNGEGGEQALRDSRDSGVVMMAAAAEEDRGGQRWQKRTMTAVDNNSMQD